MLNGILLRIEARLKNLKNTKPEKHSLDPPSGILEHRREGRKLVPIRLNPVN